MSNSLNLPDELYKRMEHIVDFYGVHLSDELAQKPDKWWELVCVIRDLVPTLKAIPHWVDGPPTKQSSFNIVRYKDGHFDTYYMRGNCHAEDVRIEHYELLDVVAHFHVPDYTKEA